MLLPSVCDIVVAYIIIGCYYCTIVLVHSGLMVSFYEFYRRCSKEKRWR